MKQVRHRSPRLLPCVLSVLVLFATLLTLPGQLQAAEKQPKNAVKVVPQETSPPEITYLTKKARLWLGRTQVLCFSPVQTVDDSRFLSFKIDQKYLHVLLPPSILPNATMGYIRLRPLAEGTTKITIGGATLDLEIVRDTAASTLDQTGPKIVSPVSGTVVWGDFVVGIEQLNLSMNGALVRPVLRLPNGQEVPAQDVAGQQPGPHLRYAFNVEAKALHPGSNVLTAVCRDKAGHEVVSEPLDVVLINPDPALVLTGDCKDQINTQLPPLPPKVPFAPQPVKFTPPVVITDPKLGPVVSFPNGGQGWIMPIESKGKGLYQMVVTARGDIGGNALPTLGIMIDRGNVLTTARLATTDWQRMPIGRPFAIEDGKHFLSVRLNNGYNQGPNNNRQLCLAKYELVRLDSPSAPALADNSAGGSMMQSAMQDTAMKDTAKPMVASTIQDTAKVASAPMMQSSMMQLLPSSGSFHVVFKHPLEGQTIAGEVQVSAMCWWPDRDHSPPPRVELIVNDKVLGAVTTPQPQFQINVTAFQTGSNRVQLRATLANGQHALSAVQTLVLSKKLKPATEPYRPEQRFYVYDPAWGNSLHDRLFNKDTPDQACFSGNGDATLTLPDELQGSYQVSIEARGTDYKGPAVATVLLKTNGPETKLGEVPAPGGLKELPVAPVTLAPGPKTLIVRFANDDSGKDGDRNLFIRYVRLDPVSTALANASPEATISYPANGATVGLADAVVTNVFGQDGIVRADLLIDGQAQHLDVSPTNGLGPVLLPLLTRGLAPGPHKLRITVQDRVGHTGQSAEVKVIASGHDAAVDSPYARALYLLNRFAYGPEPRELAAVLTMGPHAWLEARLNETMDSPAEQNEQERLHAEFPDKNAAVPRALQYLLTDGNPVRARFVMWAENHFSTWISKDGPNEKSREHDRFLELGVAPFPDLLLASVTSPAMLIYLDQQNSVAKRLNENYAREIMELHTLGVKGGYTQKDVTMMAELLTGLTLADEAPMDGSAGSERTFRYDSYLNSGTPCQILGMDLPGVAVDRRFDRVLTALNMLASHPSCAQFISRKLLEHYVSDPAPPALVDSLAQMYMETGGDLRVMLLSLVDKPEFWSSAPRVTSAIDFSVRLGRLSGLTNPGTLNEFASHSGMGMFDRATPDGYPEADGYYASSNALLQRWRFAQSVQNNFLGGGLIPNDWKPADQKWDSATTQRLVDLAAVRITGRVLTDTSNAAALQLLAAAPANTDGRLHLLTTFLCQVPETSLR